ncbi:hypothetical protein LY78DRAFT_658347 [Colletotrichum sublineola]|nr:hypothetical protein LY78DRAFT_658347 [Colletotrichum sublineola]
MTDGRGAWSVVGFELGCRTFGVEEVHAARMRSLLSGSEAFRPRVVVVVFSVCFRRGWCRSISNAVVLWLIGFGGTGCRSTMLLLYCRDID